MTPPTLTPIGAGEAAEHGIHFPEPGPGHLGFTVEPSVETGELAFANDVQLIRHPDGMVSLMIDGRDFPWFIAKDPPMQYVEASEEHPFPVLLVPLLCGTITVADAPEPPPAPESCCEDDSCDNCYEASLADALEGIVVAHPEDDETP